MTSVLFLLYTMKPYKNNNQIIIYYAKLFQKCREDGIVHLPVTDVTDCMQSEV